MMFVASKYRKHQRHEAKSSDGSSENTEQTSTTSADLSVLPCIRNRRSVFPNGFLRNPPPLSPSIIQSLLDAAICGPFHGRCYSAEHPAKFVVLGKETTVEMQHLTLRYYDKSWKNFWPTETDYKAWRKVTEDEITNRWGPVSHMIAIAMRRQSGSKRLPEWEEAAAVAAAVQNMHIQTTKFPQLGCYWSSWHDAARDSDEMKEFLSIGKEDVCMGFFIVAQVKRQQLKDRRQPRNRTMKVEWRP